MDSGRGPGAVASLRVVDVKSFDATGAAEVR